MPTVGLVGTPAARLGSVAVLLILSGCSSAVKISPAADASTSVCRDAQTRWPSSVGGQVVREVSDATAGSAWGDPAIIARCGVPAMPPTDAPCIEVDDVGWVAQELVDGVKLTTFGRDPAIEVLVPATYDSAPLLLPAFTEAARALPTNDLSCR